MPRAFGIFSYVFKIIFTYLQGIAHLPPCLGIFSIWTGNKMLQSIHSARTINKRDMRNGNGFNHIV